MSNVDEESSPLTRLYEAACPKVGAPLTEAVVLTRVMDNKNTFNPEVIQELLLSAVFYENNSVNKVAIVRVDLPFKPDSYAAFVVLNKSDTPDGSNLGKELHEVHKS
jgi:hypothetical protein